VAESLEQLWRDACVVLQGKVNPELYTRWFEPVRLLDLKEDTLQLGVAHEFTLIWLQDNFLPLIREAVNQSAKSPLHVQLVVTGDTETREKPATLGRHRQDERSPVAARVPLDAKLNTRYTFDSFVIGPNNNFAQAAALSVAQAPGRSYNPFFMYGGVGLGKTHLMQAIGHAVITSGKSRRVCYVTAEQFTNDYIQAIQTNTVTKFRKKYRQMDVLLVDDIHFLGGKERSQDEFFHTFNALIDSQKQIVLSSDRPAAEIANLESRLVSRFEWGLVTELHPPALETRIAILRKKVATFDVKIPDRVIEFLAERIRTNIRRLEGALIRVAAFAPLTGQEITIDSVETLLGDALHEEAKHTITVDAIQKQVAEHFDIRLADMTSHRRPQNVAFPRQVAMFLSRTLTDRSLVDIGERFGGRDHGTVLHACRLIDKRMAEDQRLRETISHLQQVLQR
jgi:chromosomal replication initiator protein